MESSIEETTKELYNQAMQELDAKRKLACLQALKEHLLYHHNDPTTFWFPKILELQRDGNVKVRRFVAGCAERFGRQYSKPEVLEKAVQALSMMLSDSAETVSAHASKGLGSLFHPLFSSILRLRDPRVSGKLRRLLTTYKDACKQVVQKFPTANSNLAHTIIKVVSMINSAFCAESASRSGDAKKIIHKRFSLESLDADHLVLKRGDLLKWRLELAEQLFEAVGSVLAADAPSDGKACGKWSVVWDSFLGFCLLWKEILEEKEAAADSETKFRERCAAQLARWKDFCDKTPDDESMRLKTGLALADCKKFREWEKPIIVVTSAATSGRQKRPREDILQGNEEEEEDVMLAVHRRTRRKRRRLDAVNLSDLATLDHDTVVELVIANLHKLPPSVPAHLLPQASSPADTSATADETMEVVEDIPDTGSSGMQKWFLREMRAEVAMPHRPLVQTTQVSLQASKRQRDVAVDHMFELMQQATSSKRIDFWEGFVVRMVLWKDSEPESFERLLNTVLDLAFWQGKKMDILQVGNFSPDVGLLSALLHQLYVHCVESGGGFSMYDDLVSRIVTGFLAVSQSTLTSVAKQLSDQHFGAAVTPQETVVSQAVAMKSSFEKLGFLIKQCPRLTDSVCKLLFSAMVRQARQLASVDPTAKPVPVAGLFKRFLADMLILIRLLAFQHQFSLRSYAVMCLLNACVCPFDCLKGPAVRCVVNSLSDARFRPTVQHCAISSCLSLISADSSSAPAPKGACLCEEADLAALFPSEEQRPRFARLLVADESQLLVRCQWGSTGELQSRLSLILALCTRQPELLSALIAVLSRLGPDMLRPVLKLPLLSKLFLTLGEKLSGHTLREVLLRIACGVTAEGLELLSLAVQRLCMGKEVTAPDPIVVDMLWKLYTGAVPPELMARHREQLSRLAAIESDGFAAAKSHVALLLPVLGGLAPQQLKTTMLRLLCRERDAKMQFGVLRLLKVLAMGFSRQPVPAADFLEIVHDLHHEHSSAVLVPTVKAMIELCLQAKQLFTPDVVMVVLHKLARKATVPLLLPWTMLRVFQIHKEVVPRLCSGILAHLAQQEVWKTPLWDGFRFCCLRFQPASFRVLLQLHSTQLRSVLTMEDLPSSRRPESELIGFRQRFREFALNTAKMESVPQWTLEVAAEVVRADRAR